jgi:hypothetical protein
MLYLCRSMAYLMMVCLAHAGCVFGLSAVAEPPEDGVLLGVAPALALPDRVLTITRGSGPATVRLFKGYWTLAS